MATKFSNNAATVLTADVSSSATSISVSDGSVFPTLAVGDITYLTLETLTSPPTREVVKLTARSSNTLTIVRGMDSTTPAGFTSGDKVELRLTAALLNGVLDDVPTQLTIPTRVGSVDASIANSILTVAGRSANILVGVS